MKTSKKVLTLAILACAAASASATTVTDWGALGPAGAQVHGNTYTAGDVDDIYSFTLGPGYDVVSIVNYYTAQDLDGNNAVDLTDATLKLWQGTYGDAGADVLVDSEAFGTASTNYTFSDLSAGSYYFEVSGIAGPAGSDYYLNVAANVATPPSVVPEPANMALLLAGIGMFGVMAKRRKNA